MEGFNSADTVGGNYDNKYELPIGGYFKRCPNGHSIYTINGDWWCSFCCPEENDENDNNDEDNIGGEDKDFFYPSDHDPESSYEGTNIGDSDYE